MKTSLIKFTSAMTMAIMAGALTIGQVMAAGGGNTRTTPPANATATQSRDRVQLKTQDCVYACEPAQDRAQQQSRTQLQAPTLLQDRIQQQDRTRLQDIVQIQATTQLMDAVQLKDRIHLYKHICS